MNPERSQQVLLAEGLARQGQLGPAVEACYAAVRVDARQASTHALLAELMLAGDFYDEAIKAGVIWSGVVGSYTDLLYHWRSTATPIPSPITGRRWRNEFIEQYGAPDQNPTFWDSISPNAYLTDISGPVQLHHSTTDASVPYQFSEELDQELVAAGKTVEFYGYQGDDHNLSKNLVLALQRSVAFFDRFVKK